MTYIIKSKSTIASVAKEYDMSVDELKRLNGLSSNSLEAYRPIRVKRLGDGVIASSTMAIMNTPGAFAEDRKKRNLKALPLDPKTGMIDHALGKNMVGEDGATYHIVEPLNTLYSIAKRYGTSVKKLKAMNGLKSNRIQIGQKLKVKMP